MKKPKQPKAPKWKDGLSPKQIAEAENLYRVLAGTLPALAGMIEEADGIFRDPDSIPQDNVAYIRYDGRLVARDGREKNEDIVMQQSPDTVGPVMRALCSAVKLREELEVRDGPPQAQEFYENLQNALRFYREIAGAQYSTSGDVLVLTDGMRRRIIKSGTIPDLPRKWAYMGENRKDGPTTRQLIDQAKGGYGREAERSTTRAKEPPNGFSIKNGQIFYDGKDLGFPAGQIQDFFEELINNIGLTVVYDELLKITTIEKIRGYKHQASTILKNHSVPYEITSLANEGYVLRSKSE